MKVYLVEDHGNCPGRIWAVMASEEDAKRFAKAVSHEQATECVVIHRTLFYSQPPVPGYNP